jgi:RNA 2',3'-cyclic 3'-phosphodiesterase
MTDDAPIRSFLAIEFPEEILKGIVVVQDRLKSRIYGDIRWVRPEGIHLTLKFFGDIPPGDVANISSVVEKAAAGVDPLALAIGGTGVFPDLRRPRVLWLGMTGDVERLLILQRELEGELQRIGFPREERPFRPHLTLGRIRSSRGMADLAKVLEKGRAYDAGRFVAAGLSLFRSELTPRGALYTRLKWFPFGER